MGYIIWPCSIYRAILTTGPSYLRNAHCAVHCFTPFTLFESLNEDDEEENEDYDNDEDDEDDNEDHNADADDEEVKVCADGGAAGVSPQSINRFLPARDQQKR